MGELNHIGFIMDGNGRWATARNKPRLYGHKAGATAMENIVPYAFSLGADVLSFYAFSTENKKRPHEEVSGILSLLVATLKKNLKLLYEKQIRLKVSGDISVLDVKTKKIINDAIEGTKDYKKIVNILFNYGGKAEILRAVRGLLNKNNTNPSEEDFVAELYSQDLPPVDLVIRTGGEKRLSNFMLWQTAYSEIYFTDVYWPDFKDSDLKTAVEWFNGRKRRYGAI